MPGYQHASFTGESAVSYTHLDVYKRQGQGPVDGQLNDEVHTVAHGHFSPGVLAQQCRFPALDKIAAHYGNNVAGAALAAILQKGAVPLKMCIRDRPGTGPVPAAYL